MITITTNRFIPKRFAATTYGPIILVRPEYRGDCGLLAHEKVHVWQWLMSAGLHGVMYRFSRGYRLSAELEAYREQARHYADDRMPRFAELLASNYHLRITAENALKLLRESD